MTRLRVPIVVCTTAVCAAALAGCTVIHEQEPRIPKKWPLKDAGGSDSLFSDVGETADAWEEPDAPLDGVEAEDGAEPPEDVPADDGPEIADEGPVPDEITVVPDAGPPDDGPPPVDVPDAGDDGPPPEDLPDVHGDGGPAPDDVTDPDPGPDTGDPEDVEADSAEDDVADTGPEDVSPPEEATPPEDVSADAPDAGPPDTGVPDVPDTGGLPPGVCGPPAYPGSRWISSVFIGGSMDVDGDPKTCAPSPGCYGGSDNQMALAKDILDYAAMVAISSGQARSVFWFEAKDAPVMFPAKRKGATKCNPSEPGCILVPLDESWDEDCQWMSSFECTISSGVPASIDCNAVGGSIEILFQMETTPYPFTLTLHCARISGMIMFGGDDLPKTFQGTLGGALSKADLMSVLMATDESVFEPKGGKALVLQTFAKVVPDLGGSCGSKPVAGVSDLISTVMTFSTGSATVVPPVE